MVGGFVNIFTVQIRKLIVEFNKLYTKIKVKILRDHYLQINQVLSVTPWIKTPSSMLKFQKFHTENKHKVLVVPAIA